MGDQCQTGILDFRFKLALTNLMRSSKVIFKAIKISSKVIHLYLQKKKKIIAHPLPTFRWKNYQWNLWW